MDRFKDRFGLDYLKRDSSENANVRSEGSDQLPKGMEEALVAYGRPLLDALESSPTLELKLFDVAQKINVRVDVLYPVVDYFSKKGYLVAVQDKLGNDLLKLTPNASKLLNK